MYELVVGPDRAVVFDHGTHVALAANRCTACHPQIFHILVPTTKIAHEEMNRGSSCGACHDGRQAFGVRDSTACSSCHTGRRAVTAARTGSPPVAGAAPRGPGPIRYSKREGSPGPVTFRHDAHLEHSPACASCHPRPFARTVGTARATPLHDTTACGSCHDGAKAFAVDDADACARCHAAGGAAR